MEQSLCSYSLSHTCVQLATPLANGGDNQLASTPTVLRRQLPNLHICTIFRLRRLLLARAVLARLTFHDGLLLG